MYSYIWHFINHLWWQMMGKYLVDEQFYKIIFVYVCEYGNTCAMAHLWWSEDSIQE